MIFWRFTVMGLACLWCCTAIGTAAPSTFTHQDAMAVEQALESITAKQKTIKEQREEAKRLQSLAVYTCMDQKLALIDRVADVTQRIAKKKYRPALQKQDSQQTIQYAERIKMGQAAVERIVPLATQCWCQDAELAQKMPNGINIGTQTIQIAKLCQEHNDKTDTVVKLKTPDGSEDVVVIDDHEKTNVDTNYGFPEIPAGSPFR